MGSVQREMPAELVLCKQCLITKKPGFHPQKALLHREGCGARTGTALEKGLRSPKRSLGRVRTLLALPSRHSSCVSQMQNIQKMLRIQMLAWWGTDPITPRAQGGSRPTHGFAGKHPADRTRAPDHVHCKVCFNPRLSLLKSRRKIESKRDAELNAKLAEMQSWLEMPHPGT